MDVSSLTNAYNQYYSTLSGTASTDALSGKLKAAENGQTTDDELMDVCKQFESYLLEQVFKNMEKTVMKADSEDSSTDSLVDFFKEQTVQTLASESTDQNSLGLAQMLYDQLKVNLGMDATTITEIAQNEGKTSAAAEE